MRCCCREKKCEFRMSFAKSPRDLNSGREFELRHGLIWLGDLGSKIMEGETRKKERKSFNDNDDRKAAYNPDDSTVATSLTSRNKFLGKAKVIKWEGCGSMM